MVAPLFDMIHPPIRPSADRGPVLDGQCKINAAIRAMGANRGSRRRGWAADAVAEVAVDVEDRRAPFLEQKRSHGYQLMHS